MLVHKARAAADWPRTAWVCVDALRRGPESPKRPGCLRSRPPPPYHRPAARPTLRVKSPPSPRQESPFSRDTAARRSQLGLLGLAGPVPALELAAGVLGQVLNEVVHLATTLSKRNGTEVRRGTMMTLHIFQEDEPLAA